MSGEQKRDFDDALDNIRHYEERERERKRARAAEVAAMMARSAS